MPVRCCRFGLCRRGGPKPATYVTDISATLNGDAYSSIEGQLTYWFRYGEATSYGTETPRRTIENTETVAHQVSAPIQGLTSGTTYHWQMCVQDEEEDPPRAVCSKDQTFTTRATPGRSGILFTSTRYGADDLIYMTAAGADSAPLYRDPYSWDGAPEWSPDGQRIAFDRYGYDVGSEKVFVAKADGSNPANITDNNTINRAPAWSPDGTKIAFSAGTPDDDSPYEDIYVMSTDGSNRTRLTYDPEPDTYPSWSPDGTKIVFNSSRDTSHGQDEIYVMQRRRLRRDPAHLQLRAGSRPGMVARRDPDPVHVPGQSRRHLRAGRALRHRSRRRQSDQPDQQHRRRCFRHLVARRSENRLRVFPGRQQ